MFCTKCGNQVEDSQQFCTKCGQQVDVADGSVRQQESAPKTKSTITAKIIEGVIFVAIAAAFFGYKYYTSGLSMEQLTECSAKLLKGALEDKAELMKYCDVREVKDCVLVKDSGNTYRGTAKVVFEAKPDGKGKRSTAAIQYGFDFIYDRESNNAMLQNGNASDKTDLVTFLNLCMEDSEAENANEDDKESENSTEESAAESDEDRTISSFLGFEFGKDINELCTDCGMSYSKEYACGNAKLKKPFRMFKAGACVDFAACPTTKRMYKLSISVGIPDVAVRKREYEKCRDIIQKKYGIKSKESGKEVYGVVAGVKSEFVVGNVTILLEDIAITSMLVLSATNTQLEKEAKEEYEATLPSGDDEDAL